MKQSHQGVMKEMEVGRSRAALGQEFRAGLSVVWVKSAWNRENKSKCSELRVSLSF